MNEDTIDEEMQVLKERIRALKHKAMHHLGITPSEDEAEG